MAAIGSGHRELSPATTIELSQLYASQVQAIDDGDAEGWAQTFTPDGAFRSPTYGRDFVGYIELCEFVRNQAAGSTARQCRHWFNAFRYAPAADGAIESRFYGMIVATETGHPPVILRSFVVDDLLVRVDERWLVRERNVHVDGL